MRLNFNSGRKIWVLSYYHLCYASIVNIDLVLHSDRNWNARSDSCAELLWACKMVQYLIKSPLIHLFILCCTVNLISHYMIWILIYTGFEAGKQSTHICSNIPCDLLLVRECSLRVNARVSACCRNLYSHSGKKTTPLSLCACTALSPERPWSIIWILRNYCHAADDWDSHANSSWELFRSNSAPAAWCRCWRGSCSAGLAAAGARAPALDVGSQLHAVNCACFWRVSWGTESGSKCVLTTLFTFLSQSSGLVCLQPPS